MTTTQVMACAYCGTPVPPGVEPAQFECCGEVGHTDSDYCATLRDYKPGDPIGYGPTRQAAIQDLKGQA